jgi:hypothetical protein
MSQMVAAPPEKVAAVVEEALTARRPRGRYVVSVGPRLQLVVMASVPTMVGDWVLAGRPVNRTDVTRPGGPTAGYSIGTADRRASILAVCLRDPAQSHEACYRAFMNGGALR